MASNTPIGIVLAAGSGKRFDPVGVQNKLTARLGSGGSVAAQSVKNVRAVLTDVIVVVRSMQLVDQLSSSGCTVLFFSDADQGMGASLAFATSYLVTHHPDTVSVLVALADMPFIKTSTISEIVFRLNTGADIVQPIYQSQPGHPVGFSKRHFPALMSLTGDTGARHLLQQFSVAQVDVDDPGIIRDIDYLSDLQGL